MPSGPKNGDVTKKAVGYHKTVGYYGKYIIPVHVGGALAHFGMGQRIFARMNPFI